MAIFACNEFDGFNIREEMDTSIDFCGKWAFIM